MNMKNRLNMLNKSSKNNLIYLTVSILFICLMLFGCGSDRDAGMVEFLCLDQSGAPIEKVAVTFNNKSKKSDDKGLCQFRVKLDRSNLRRPVDAQKAGFQFIGPDDVYLEQGKLVKYGLNLLSNKMNGSPNDPGIPAKLSFQWVYPDLDSISKEFVGIDTSAEEPKTEEIEEKPLPIPSFSVNVDTDPPGSMVTISKGSRTIKRAKAPFAVSLQQGNYQFEATSSLGYKTFRGEIKINSNNPIKLKHEIIPLKLSIITDPQNADVYLNEAFQGRTSCAFELRRQGIYNLQIKMENFQKIGYEIDFRPSHYDTNVVVIGKKITQIPFDRKIEIRETLKGNPVLVLISLAKEGIIKIDGKQITPKAIKRWEGNISAGRHDIEVIYKDGTSQVKKNYLIIKETVVDF